MSSSGSDENVISNERLNSYRGHVKVLLDSTESVSKNSKQKAADELKEFYVPNEDGLYDVALSGYGTWRKRGYSLTYGVVTVMSTITGKLLIYDERVQALFLGDRKRGNTRVS